MGLSRRQNAAVLQRYPESLQHSTLLHSQAARDSTALGGVRRGRGRVVVPLLPPPFPGTPGGTAKGYQKQSLLPSAGLQTKLEWNGPMALRERSRLSAGWRWLAKPSADMFSVLWRKWELHVSRSFSTLFRKFWPGITVLIPSVTPSGCWIHFRQSPANDFYRRSAQVRGKLGALPTTWIALRLGR